MLDCQTGGEWTAAIPSRQDIGKNICQIMPVDIAERMLQHVRRALESGVTQVFEYQLPARLTDSEEPAAELADYETRLVVSGPNEVLGIGRDITERKRAERRAIRTERLAALGQLAAALAHEINNPLQVIQSHLDLVLDFPLEPGEKDHYLQIIRREIERLTDVTRRVLNYARPQAIQPQLVLVTDLIEQVLVLANKRLEQSDIQVLADLQDVSPVLAAPDQLAQVFLNLVINAIEAMAEGGRLQIKVFERDGQVMACFINEGAPIPETELPHIFEPFYTTKPDGSGLGLWVSHSLVQQHAGLLMVKNLRREPGVAFTVKLPAAQTREMEMRG